MEKLDLSKEQTIFPEPRLLHLESIFLLNILRLIQGSFRLQEYL